MIALRAALAIAEEDFSAVVMDLRITHSAARVIEQRGEVAGGHVPAVKLGAFPPCLAVGVVGVVAEVRIPMTVGLVKLARGEDELALDKKYVMVLCGGTADIPVGFTS